MTTSILDRGYFDVLDKGYMEIIEVWGSDERIIEAARMSTNKGFQGWGHPAEPGDERLLAYLWKHKHHSPFEMAGLTVEVKAPLMVFREWHRHRTFSYNEMSGRYTQMLEEFYLPSAERLANGGQALHNKQSSGAPLDDEVIQRAQHIYYTTSLNAWTSYQALLQQGVSRELARLVLPVNIYSKMRASGNLRNWLHFLRLRQDAGAQWEIRQYANVLHDLLAQQFPRTLALFDEG